MKSLLEQALEAGSGFESMKSFEFGEPRLVLDCSTSVLYFPQTLCIHLAPIPTVSTQEGCLLLLHILLGLACVIARDPGRGLVIGIRGV